jgi:hypothetical protein
LIPWRADQRSMLARMACLPTSGGWPGLSRIASSVHRSVSATGSRDNVAAMSCWWIFSMAARSAWRLSSDPADKPRPWGRGPVKTANPNRTTAPEHCVMPLPIIQTRLRSSTTPPLRLWCRSRFRANASRPSAESMTADSLREPRLVPRLGHGALSTSLLCAQGIAEIIAAPGHELTRRRP